MVESDGLENRCAGNGTVGSNPTLSAINLLKCSYLAPTRAGLLASSTVESRRDLRGRAKLCRLRPLAISWKGAGVAYLAALEMLCTGNGTVGSNPTLSAI